MQDMEVISPSCSQLTASWSDQCQSLTNHIHSSKLGGLFKPKPSFTLSRSGLGPALLSQWPGWPVWCTPCFPLCPAPWLNDRWDIQFWVACCSTPDPTLLVSLGFKDTPGLTVSTRLLRLFPGVSCPRVAILWIFQQSDPSLFLTKTLPDDLGCLCFVCLSAANLFLFNHVSLPSPLFCWLCAPSLPVHRPLPVFDSWILPQPWLYLCRA